MVSCHTEYIAENNKKKNIDYFNINNVCYYLLNILITFNQYLYK